ncbi:Suf-domain-containing protein [Meredithblackwellia eburnea MCA 4105]
MSDSVTLDPRKRPAPTVKAAQEDASTTQGTPTVTLEQPADVPLESVQVKQEEEQPSPSEEVSSEAGLGEGAASVVDSNGEQVISTLAENTTVIKSEPIAEDDDVIVLSDDSATPTGADSSGMEAAIAATLGSLDASPSMTVEPPSDEHSISNGESGGADPSSDSPMRELASAPSSALYPPSNSTSASGTPIPQSAPASASRPSRFSDASALPLSADHAAVLEAGRAAALAFAAKTKPAPPAPTPISRVAQLKVRVENDPLDGEARLALIADAEQKGDLERTREVYEEFLTVFPDATQQWISYANLELSHNLFQNVEAIFGRCLRLSPAVDLWKFYLDYIRRVNPTDASAGERAKEARGIIAKAFEYALQHVGQDRRAGDMWMEYINFLKEGQNRGTWEDQQRMDALRKAYQRAVCIPVNNVEAIWQDYNTFENNLNKMTVRFPFNPFPPFLGRSHVCCRACCLSTSLQLDHGLGLPLSKREKPVPLMFSVCPLCHYLHLSFFSLSSYLLRTHCLNQAKKFVAELSPSYMTARKALRELRAMHENVTTPALPHRPDWSEVKDRALLEIWKRYLAWEESNPLDLEEAAALQARVAFAYKKAVAALRFYSAIWFQTAEYYTKLGKVEEARGFLQSGLSANPASLLLGYSIVDLDEGRQDYLSCYKVFEGMIDHFHARIATLDSATEKETAEALAAYEGHQQQSTEGEAEGEGDEGRQKTLAEKEEIKTSVAAKRQPETDVMKKAAANVWIAHMRFARRAEGVKQARAIFTKARKSPHLLWQVVEASANMELHWNNEAKIATNVFELGLKSFAKDPEYVLQYLDFLIRSNNPNNARALFERTVAVIEPAKAKPIWDRMAQFEHQYGDYLAAQKLSVRYSEAFPDVSHIERFAQRNSYFGLDDIIKEDLGTSRSAGARRESRRESRSPSPQRGGRKRSLSPEPFERAPSVERGSGDFKRSRPNQRIEGSPAPSSTDGRGGGGGPVGRVDSDVGRRRPMDQGPPAAFNRPIPFALDPRGDHVAPLPDAVVFFLSLLPSAAAFNGPILNPANIVDVIGTTMLPGSAPGPGLPGERLGIPPRPKAQQQNQGGGFNDRPMSPRRREPDYSEGGHGGGGGRHGGGGGGGRHNGGGGGGRFGRRY